MSKKNVDFRLRMIDESDIENLRNWKNDNKNSFFLQQDITPLQQVLWYEAFKNRRDDFMFIVEQQIDEHWHGIGCMGFRKVDDEKSIDAYNIIRARRIEPSSFTMSDAFRVMLKFATGLYVGQPVRCKVLTNNPAVEWYKKNHFRIIDEADDYYLMQLDEESLESVELVAVN